jgi:hypothetical protein
MLQLGIALVSTVKSIKQERKPRIMQSININDLELCCPACNKEEHSVFD